MISEQPSSDESRHIKKADGITDAEKYLARLCEQNFLSLWSYPGVYRDQGKQGEGGHGKEICDLLVIFGQHVVIFSDKHCRLQNSGNEDADWRRWFKKAIKNSAQQAWGAERWIREFPKRVFMDRECKHPLPIDLPSMEKAIFHLVVVAHGVSSRIKKKFAGSSGSLILDTTYKGFDNHLIPFTVGDIAPQKTFVHILDEDSLHTVMTTLDTISDFTSYLNKRKNLLRGKIDISTTGEEELLALYLTSLNSSEEHDFVFPLEPGQVVHKIFLQEGQWHDFQKSDQRRRQMEEDRISYSWDALIEKFNYYAMRGEQHFVTGGGIKDTEKVLHFMAREPRWHRRYLAKSLVSIVRTTPADYKMLRVMTPSRKGDPYYVFLLLPTAFSKTDEEYRTVRRNFLEQCCRVVKLEHPAAEDIVGIATESGSDYKNRSEDAIYVDVRVWTAEMESEAKEAQKKLKILTNPKQFHEHIQEYPDAPAPFVKMKNPRNKPCPCGSGKKFKHCCLNKGEPDIGTFVKNLMPE